VCVWVCVSVCVGVCECVCVCLSVQTYMKEKKTRIKITNQNVGG